MRTLILLQEYRCACSSARERVQKKPTWSAVAPVLRIHAVYVRIHAMHALIFAYTKKRGRHVLARANLACA